MKDINTFITEGVKFDNDYFGNNDGKKVQYEYVLIFPAGAIEMYTKKGLDDILNEDPDEWDDPDLYDTYSELSGLSADNEWRSLSGPVGKGDLKDTLGIHYKK